MPSLWHVIYIVVDGHNLASGSGWNLSDQLVGKDLTQVIEL